MIEALIQQLKRHEGLSLRPYICSAGKLTIGYGRNLEDVGVSLEEAEDLLRHDVSRALADLESALPWSARLNEVRRCVLANMVFNLGVMGLLGFQRMLSSLEDGDFEGAAREMLDSAWRVQVGDRALELAEQMRSGLW